jgi:hypothetical protein
MREELEQLITALIDHAVALQRSAEAQQAALERAVAELPQRVEGATRSSVAQVVQVQSRRLQAEGARIERLARSATLRWGLIYAIGALVLSGAVALAAWWPVHQEHVALGKERRAVASLKADEAALWAGIERGQRGDLIARCGDAHGRGRLCVRINRSAGEYGRDHSYAVVWGH